MNRRTFAAALVGVSSLSGCLGESSPADSSETTTEVAAESRRTETTGSQTETKERTAGETTALTDWERSTDCEGEHDGMYDSVVRVERVATDLPSEYAPIHFSKLSDAEKEILRLVTEEGGYGTCDASEAFHRFVERVSDHRDRQDGDMHVYLERDGTYYGLYVEVTDQVYAH